DPAVGRRVVAGDGDVRAVDVRACVELDVREAGVVLAVRVAHAGAGARDGEGAGVDLHPGRSLELLEARPGAHVRPAVVHVLGAEVGRQAVLRAGAPTRFAAALPSTNAPPAAVIGGKEVHGLVGGADDRPGAGAVT